ncbi:methyl-accepting chemotaxis protein [Paenibacillus phyllosphaerae]|uniref:Methyl-accepting chemotaxis protein n=1 Tax=Paenibacillus phyllosphaerae TaxID=274593 RepID=A0A7W5FLI0_9BACL|nr:methyl-accepting chemotaxis protein [Paenibacillus phyllosphaerae]MBB3109196.1 methyl-accepting chemotaxis protein [Paenibacillus phyllosphaerae]
MRVKVIVLLLIVSLLPLLSITAIQYNRSSSALNDKTVDELQQRAELNAIIMNNWVTAKISSLQTLLSETPVMKEGRYEDIMPLLKTLDASDAEIIKASFIDSSGLLHNTLDQTIDASKFGNFVSMKENKKVNVSSIKKDSITGSDIVILDVPVLNDNQQFVGLIQSVLDPKLISDVVARIQFETSGYGLLLDTEGTIIASKNKDSLGTNIFDTYAEDTRDAAKQLFSSKATSQESIRDVNGVMHAIAYATVDSAGWRLLVSAPDSEVYEEVNALRQNAMYLILISVILVIIIAVIVARVMIKPILALSDVMKRIATGDLTDRMQEKGNDEIGELRRNVNYMLDSFSHILNKMKNSIEVVAASSEQLTATAIESSATAEHVTGAVEKVVNGAKAQHEAAGQTSTATEEMAQGVTRIAHSSSDVAESAQGVTIEVQRGRDGVQQAISQIQAASHSVEASAQTVSTLQQKSMLIKQIVGVISEISSQTNMLALNASIEAARAGEHGRGFAVVAGEVKKLADQTSRSAVEIESIIKDMLEAVSSADQTMHVGLSEVSQGEQLVLQVGQTFDKILSEVQAVNEQIQEVSAAAQQISAGTEEVAASAHDVYTIAQDTSGQLQTVSKRMEDQLQSMKEINGSSEALSRMAIELQEAASKFIVK